MIDYTEIIIKRREFLEKHIDDLRVQIILYFVSMIEKSIFV